MRKNIVIIILFIWPVFAYSQTRTDSLLNLLRTTSDTNKISLFLELSEDYLNKNDFENAYIYYKKYSDVKDSLQCVNFILKEKKLQAQLLNELHKEKLNELSLNNLEQDRIISKLKIYKNILLASVFFILILLSLLLYYFKNKIEANKKLSIQNNQIREQNLKIKNHTAHLAKVNHELKKLSIVASKTDNAIILANSKGEIEWINDGFTRLYGYTLEEFITEKGFTLTESSSNQRINEIADNIAKEKKSQIYESEVVAKDGKKYRTQTTLTPILNDKDEIIQFIAIDTDISKLKDVEDELQKLLITKDKFFSIIAHDLKNPFNSLMGLAQLLYHGYERMSPEKVRHFHKNLYQISKNGYELLVNLLEWSRAQMGKIKFKPEKQSLFAITEETFSLYGAKAIQKEIALNNSLNIDSYAIADRNMLKTIFRNIVSNALKFTERGGAIEVSEEVQEDYIQITIKDTGVGISEEDLNKLFNLDESHTTHGTEEESGTGLGLILCKEFIEQHEGKIWVESKVGVGSKFIFTLPLKERYSD